MKIAKDVAEAEFNRFVEAMYLDVNENDMDIEEKKDFSVSKALLIRAICEGSLIINDDGTPTYTPVRGDKREPITFYELEGHNLMDMDKGKSNENVKKMFSIMQSLTKKPVGYFANMKKNPDLKICLAITNLFLEG